MTAIDGGHGHRVLRPVRAWLAWWPLLLLLLALLAGTVRAQADVLPVPALSARVMDTTATLGAAEREALEARLAAFEAEAGSQIVVLLVPTTAPEDIAAYAQRVADTWKVGRRDVGDGLLIVVAKNDRRVRIEVAKALEGAIPDLAARQVIDRAITPAFKAGDFAGGLQAAVDQLAARIRGEALPAPRADGEPPLRQGLGWEDLAIFLFVGVPVAGAVLTAVLGRKLGSLATAGGTGALAAALGGSVLVGVVAGVVALLLVGVIGVGAGGLRAAYGRRGGFSAGVPPIIWGGGGGGWGGGGGGGFSSGGGGDFGGGGASGNW